MWHGEHLPDALQCAARLAGCSSMAYRQFRVMFRIGQGSIDWTNSGRAYRVWEEATLMRGQGLYLGDQFVHNA